MMRHPQVRPNVEQFVVQHVFPEFGSSLPYMRSIVSFFGNSTFYQLANLYYEGG